MSSVIIALACCSMFFCSVSFFDVPSDETTLLRFLIFVNVSIIAIVVAVASGLRRMVASMYKPFSVNAFGKTLDLDSEFAVKIFDRK